MKLEFKLDQIWNRIDSKVKLSAKRNLPTPADGTRLDLIIYARNVVGGAYIRRNRVYRIYTGYFQLCMYVHRYSV